MKFLKDKLFDRLISMNKGKITSKITELRKRHKNSQNMNITLSCSLCEACLHAYSYSCLDNSIHWNMCKHKHLVSQYKKSVGENCMNLTRNEGNYY
nr:unnamed protein product [Callosobruchus analis]